MACKTTGKSGSKLFTILPGFSMFLRNYAMFCDFKSAKVAKRLGLCPRPRLLRQACPATASSPPPPRTSILDLPLTWPNARGPPSYPCIHCQTQREVVGFGRTRGGLSRGGGGGGAISAFCPRAPNTLATPLLAVTVYHTVLE